ncbi:MAG TPA: C45 family peptidase, partial [Cyclobacteriaceae bacterium]|nr:C45 family peptidase [Cyclobacteriaceae bacterium]
KIVAFYNPAEGHPFMMVTFGGMAGALSGMNNQGLTVTINAAKSGIPSASAMPVSLVAREILQYASTIEEAYTLARQRKMFVSESFLIGSARDGKAAIIEKTPQETELVDAANDLVVCTNHFQGKKLGGEPLNLEHIHTSASWYRWQRLKELLNGAGKISVGKSAKILRDQLGLGGKAIGLGNEKSINQLVAHHAIIFQPVQQKVWISTAPWQLGKFVCYDLHKIFGMKMTRDREIYDSTSSIQPDTFLVTKQFRDFQKFSPYRFPFQPGGDVQPDSLVKWNPGSYLSYLLAGDACFRKKDFAAAQNFYKTGLTKEIATLQERDYMLARLNECKKELP